MSNSHFRQKSGKQPSIRQLRIGEQIRHMLSEMLVRGTIHDRFLESVSITVTEVKLTADLSQATIYVEPLGGEEEDKALAALKRHAGYIRGEIGHKLKLRRTPSLVFRIDDSFNEAARIDALLRSRKVVRDLP